MESQVVQPTHAFRENALIPPIDDQVSIGELNCELIRIKSNDDPNISRFLQAGGVIYPHLVIPLLEADEAHTAPMSVTRASASKKPFPLSLFESIGAYLQEQPFDETEVPEASVPLDAPPMPQLKPLDLVTLSLQSFFQSLWGAKRTIDPCIAVHPDFPIRAFSWHPYLAKFAVALQDNTVRVYDLNSGSWSPVVLQHEFQRKVFGLAWKPLSGQTLAVATLHGVLLWNIESKSVSLTNHSRATGTTPAAILAAQHLSTPYGASSSSTFNPGISSFSSLSDAWAQLGLEGGGVTSTKLVDSGAWCTFLHHFGHSPMNAIDFSPGGRFLAAGSVQSGQMVVFDVLTETVTPITQYIPGNITKILWSPNDEFVFVASSANIFRVFHTRNWASQRWANLPQAVNAACWSGEGSHLAFTVKGESKVYIAYYSCESNQVEGELVAVLDMAPYMVKSNLFADGEAEFGGALSYVAWDETSSRLAVAIEDTELIAIFQCNSLSLDTSFQPLGYLRGPPETATTGLYFRPNFPRGALLTATFSNGKISFFPMYFLPTSA